MAQTSAPEGGPAADTRYAGYSRFELELEASLPSTFFVQCLANPLYLNHLATQKLFEDPCFVAYLDYLQYFSKPEYISFLTYPGPTLKALQLLQLEQFRKDILNPLMVETLIQQWVVASMDFATPKGRP